MNTNSDNPRLHKRRAVAPVIATLLLVAIAVVGGAIVFAFSQNFFSSSQISGRPTIEAVKILGYDARAIETIADHNGNNFATGSGGDADSLKEAGERIAVYIKNDSVQKITISEARLGGIVYNYTSTAASLAALGTAPYGNYALASAGSGGGTELISRTAVADVQPGQTTSVVFGVTEDMKLGRDVQFKLTTSNGGVFVGTVVVGQQSG